LPASASVHGETRQRHSPCRRKTARSNAHLLCLTDIYSTTSRASAGNAACRRARTACARRQARFHCAPRDEPCAGILVCALKATNAGETSRRMVRSIYAYLLRYIRQRPPPHGRRATVTLWCACSDRRHVPTDDMSSGRDGMTRISFLTHRSDSTPGIRCISCALALKEVARSQPQTCQHSTRRIVWAWRGQRHSMALSFYYTAFLRATTPFAYLSILVTTASRAFAHAAHGRGGARYERIGATRSYTTITSPFLHFFRRSFAVASCDNGTAAARYFIIAAGDSTACGMLSSSTAERRRTRASLKVPNALPPYYFYSRLHLPSAAQRTTCYATYTAISTFTSPIRAAVLWRGALFYYLCRRLAILLALP